MATYRKGNGVSDAVWKARQKKRYPKVCEECGAKQQARAANKRNCPRCGGTLKKYIPPGASQ